MQNSTLKYSIFLGVLFACTLGVQFFVEKYWITSPHDSLRVTIADAPVLPPPTEFFTNPVEARAAFVYDIKNKKILFEKNIYQRLPLASLTKIATVLSLFESFAPRTWTTITQSDLHEEGDSGLIMGEEWNTKSLAQFSLLVSSNDGTSALAASMGDHSAFLSYVNGLFSTIGNGSLSFSNESGLDDQLLSRTGGVGSAYDVSLLFEKALEKVPDIFEPTAYATWQVSSLQNTHQAKNTNEIVSHIPGLIAGKTGYTDLAGGNLIIAFDADIGRPIIVCVLGSSREGRFTDVQALVAQTLQFIHYHPE